MPAQFHHTGTGGMTCCLATDCNNLQFTFKQLPLHRGGWGGGLSIVYRLVLCLAVEQHVRVYASPTVLFALCVCFFLRGRLFELDPELLSLFQYATNCGSTQDSLSSPEFLEHVTKVSSAGPQPPLQPFHRSQFELSTDL